MGPDMYTERSGENYSREQFEKEVKSRLERLEILAKEGIEAGNRNAELQKQLLESTNEILRLSRSILGMTRSV